MIPPLNKSLGKIAYAIILSCLADRVKFPRAVVTIYFAEYHSGHIVIIFGKIVLAKFLIGFRVTDSDERVSDQTEVLSALHGLINI